MGSQKCGGSVRWRLGLRYFRRLLEPRHPESCPAPADLHDGWKVAAPAQEGLDPELICAIGPRLEKLKEADPNGVVVIRHGVLVYEHYFTGWDWHLGSPPAYDLHDAGTLHDLHSISKSVVALLIGIAFDRGWLKYIDAPALSFFPDYPDLRGPDKNRITLRDLLTMTSGLAWPELPVSFSDPSSPWRGLMEAPDPYRFVLQQPIAATPGTMWNYDSGGVELGGIILKRVTKQPVDQFAEQALFEPLGIKQWEWAQFANGNPIASAGLRLRPRDLAKIGQLVLDEGTWHGRQIVSAGWIKEMTSPQLPRWQSPEPEEQTPMATSGGWAGCGSTAEASSGSAASVTAGSGSTSCRVRTWSSRSPPAFTNNPAPRDSPVPRRWKRQCAQPSHIDRHQRARAPNTPIFKSFTG
jgi:CubicO group peptidase (beta-lactamase class C family)